MKTEVLILCIFCMSVLMPFDAVEAAQEECDAEELIQGEDAYNKLVCEGIESMDTKHYKEAIATFNRALSTPLNEVPNFSLYARTALAYFLAGEKNKAEEYVAKAQLSLSVLFGIVDCKEVDGGFALFRNGVWPIDSQYQGEITQKMCGAAYEYFYEDRTLESILQDAQLIEKYLQAKRQIEGQN